MKILNKKVILNTVKFTVAASIAIAIATALKLSFEVSAGIVTILTIQPTKKETVRTAAGRIAAFIVSLVISYAVFGIFGYTMTAFLIYLAIYILICQLFNWQNAMTICPVLMSHFLSSGNMTVHTVCNEIIIFVTGVGVGITTNLHLRKDTDYIEQLKAAADNRIREILLQTSENLLTRDNFRQIDDCFIDLKNHIRIAKNVAAENYNNQFGTDDVYDMEYIRMRDKQCWILYEMHKSVKNIETTPFTAQHISDFLALVAQVYHTINTGEAGRKLMEKFKQLDNSMKKQPLPADRKEFEDRAKLYGLLRLIEEFIQIKIYFYDKYSPNP